MKKSLLALAVLGAFAGAAQAQSSVTIYGIVDTGIAYTSKAASSIASGAPISSAATTGSRFALNSGVVQGSRIGFKGVEDLGGGLSAIFNLETGFTNDNGGLQGDTGSTNLFRRKSVVGLGGGFGTVLLGRQTDILDDISSMTGVADFGGVIGNSGSNLNRLQGTRTNNSVRYNTTNLGGFTGSLIYGFGEQAGKTTSGQAFGLGGMYNNGPLSLGAAYYQSKLGATPADVSITNGGTGTGTGAYSGNAGDTGLKTFTLAAAYQFSAVKVYGNWSRVKQPRAVSSTVGTTGIVVFNGTTPQSFVIGGTNNNKTDTFELGANYALTPSLKLLGNVTHSRISYVESGAPKGKLTQISLGTDYWLSKRTDLYAFVSNMRATDTINPGIVGGSTGGANSQTALIAGIRHKF
jgi:predicted porin